MAVKKDYIKIVKDEANPQKACMVISGFIAPDENSSATICAALAQLELSYQDIEICFMNCYGGSINEGIPTYNKIKASTRNITTKAEGLVASMGAILFLSVPIEKRSMAEMSRLMLHEAKASAYGNAAELRATADLIDTYQKDLTNILVAATGKTEQEVMSSFMKPGVDTYLTCEQACKMGLVNDTCKGMINQDLPQNVVEHSDITAIYNFYQKQITNQLNPKIEDMKNIALKLGLPENATEAEILNALEKQKNESKTLKNALEASNKAKVETLISNALKVGKITEKAKASWEKMASNDFDGTKTILDEMKAHTPLSGKIENKITDNDNKFEGKTYGELMKDNAGSKYLAKLKNADSAAFNQLKNEHLENLRNQ